jgi:hypothetical protein
MPHIAYLYQFLAKKLELRTEMLQKKSFLHRNRISSIELIDSELKPVLG